MRELTTSKRLLEVPGAFPLQKWPDVLWELPELELGGSCDAAALSPDQSEGEAQEFVFTNAYSFCKLKVYKRLYGYVKGF